MSKHLNKIPKIELGWGHLSYIYKDLFEMILQNKFLFRNWFSNVVAQSGT